MTRIALLAGHAAHGLDTGTDTPHWRQQGTCATLPDPDIMYPFPHDTAAEVRAVAVCGPCPVKHQCARQALNDGEPHGVWGGMTERERRHRRAGKVWRCPGCGRRHYQPHWGQIYCTACRTPRNKPTTPTTTPRGRAAPIPCGSYKAFQRHRSHGEPIDEACRQACRDYDQQRRRVAV